MAVQFDDQFEVIDQMDHLGFNSIMHGRHKVYDRPVIGKYVQFQNLSHLNVYLREAFCQAKLDAHPQVCQILDLSFFPAEREEDGYYLRICIEQLDSDLDTEINTRKESDRPYTETELSQFLSGMVDVLKFAQAKGVYKLGDFGAAKLAQSGCGLHIGQGTSEYVSPQLRECVADPRNRFQYDPYLSDVYSLALTVYSMATLHIIKSIPERNEAEEHARDRLEQCGYSEGFIDIIGKMLSAVEEERPNYESLQKKLADLSENSSAQSLDTLLDKVKQTWELRKLRNVSELYCRKCDLMKTLAKSGDYETASSLLPCEFNYVPLTHFVAEQTLSLTVERINEGNQYVVVGGIQTPLGSLTIPAGHSELILRKTGDIVTLSETRNESPVVLRKLRLNVPERLVKGQLYRLGNFMLIVEDINIDALRLSWKFAANGSYGGTQVFPSSQSLITIGRGRENSLVLNDISVSNCHLRIEYRAGSWDICDSRSTNGTLIYCHNLYSLNRESDEMLVADGEEIQLSEDHYRLKLSNVG